MGQIVYAAQNAGQAAKSGPDALTILIYVIIAIFAIIVFAYLSIRKRLESKQTKAILELTSSTKSGGFSFDLFLQKFYIFATQVPFIRRYTFKIRRRIEILNLADEYLTRKETAKVMFKALIFFIIAVIVVLLLTGENYLLKISLLVIIIFFLETFISGSVDKLDNDLLKEQIDFFAEIRHAYHQYNMVEEAIYEVAQNDELPQAATQAEYIYEVLISADPETELEMYYDIAPNPYLKEFAGISYLTREFGDRKDENGASLYLRNLNNITQEMQIEILKRDKLDYLFQSLSAIAMLPIFFIETVKNMAMGLFGFTKQFYNGSLGLIVQVIIMIVSIICYILIRKIKDNASTDRGNTDNPWQNKLYNIAPVKKVVDLFIPKRKTKEYRKKITLLKEVASPLKIEWLYINKLLLFILGFLATFGLAVFAHQVQRNYILNEPTADYNLIGNMGEVEEREAMAKTERQNKVIYQIINIPNVTESNVTMAMQNVPEYKDMNPKDKEKEIEQIISKVNSVQVEYLKWFEVLISVLVAFLGYAAPEIMMYFQKRMRYLEMENEVMEYHTIILMLMKIERVNVEMILEWLERYAVIFKDPISKCVNNFESGPWEALEELKEDVNFPQLIRIIESLQAAVEQIPIREAFDELDTEREYYRDKRKQSNEELIDKKSLIGKVVGFTPMILLFVGYLIAPMVGIGFTSMGEAFKEMQSTSQ